MTQSKDLSLRHQPGFALVITLVMVALLTIMAVAFLFSSGTDRATGRAAVNKAKADLAAQTAVNAAVSRLVDNLSTYPDSATSWESVNQPGGGLQYQGTTLYYREQTPEATAGGTPSPLHALPLISGAQPVQIPNPPQTAQNREATLRAALPVFDNTNSFDLNHARFSGDIQGWIGAPVGSPSRPEFRGQWIELKDSDNKVTGRYAYWMEDESFKANANLMGNTLRGSNTLGNAPAQIPLQGLLKTVLTSGDPDEVANDTVTLRTAFPGSSFFEYRALNQVNGQPTLADATKFEATVYSGTSNLTRSGSKRVNLNKVVTTSTDATEIRKQLDELIQTIKYHLPNFAQRFYRTGSDKNSLDVPDTGTVSHRTIYLNKIAANIRDYIDTDSQPTIVNSDLTINIGTPPMHSIPAGGASGANEVIAIGKEAPFIQEYMLRVKQIEPKLRPLPSATANYEIQIDHYVEVWNMTNKDITVASLGSNPFLRIANQFGWASYGGVDIPAGSSRDFSIPLSSFKNANGNSLVFSAGTATVLTTDPVALPSTLQNVDPTRVFRPPSGTPPDSVRVYRGTCKAKTSGSYPHLDAQPQPGTSNPSNSGDTETEIILGNDTGVIESFGAPTVWYITVNADDGTQTTNTTRIDTTKYYFRASSLKGNSPSYAPTVSQVGDPRTNNEQLSLNSGAAVADDQTSYKTELNRNSPPSPTNNDASFTSLNSTYVDPTLWTDPSAKATADAPHAPMVIANASLTSIGQLGDIFDAVRSIGVSGSIIYSRGGGRTFKIGQPERYDATMNTAGLWDGNSNSASREWTAWRLTDIFTTSDLVPLDGPINVNGANRDGGAALKAALYGYNFQSTPDSDPSLAGAGFDIDPTNATDKINVLIGQIQGRLKNQDPFDKTSGPFAERGELSEMPIFNTGSDLASGVNTATVIDRGREEIFRRLVELTTTRGNTFTIYAVGQSLIPQPGTNPPIVTSTTQLKVTFRVDPVWNAGTPADPFDPTITTRFKRPDKYAIKILYAGE